MWWHYFLIGAGSLIALLTTVAIALLVVRTMAASLSLGFFTENVWNCIYMTIYTALEMYCACTCIAHGGHVPCLNHLVISILLQMALNIVCAGDGGSDQKRTVPSQESTGL